MYNIIHTYVYIYIIYSAVLVAVIPSDPYSTRHSNVQSAATTLGSVTSSSNVLTDATGDKVNP